MKREVSAVGGEATTRARARAKKARIRTKARKSLT